MLLLSTYHTYKLSSLSLKFHQSSFEKILSFGYSNILPKTKFHKNMAMHQTCMLNPSALEL